MLFVPALLIFLAITAHGQPRLMVREHGKMCSRWMTRNSAENLRSTHDDRECGGEASIERRGFHARVCCPASMVTRSDDEDFPTECGKQQYAPHRKRIVGGSEAIPNSWPWEVQLDADGALCGGSLIDTRHVLTAAHCIDNPNQPELYTVYLGRHYRNKPVRHGHAIVAEEIFVHEDYKGNPFFDDIAIIRLSQPVEISAIVNTICLPGPEASDEGDEVWVVGWGRVVHEGQASSVLKQAQLETMSSVCKKAYMGSYDSEREMCAGVRGGGHGTCQGDSGGPLMYESDETWYLNGIVSSGYGCAFDGYPTIYTRVTYYLPWIHNIIDN